MAKLADTTVYGNLTVTGTISGTMAQSLSVQSYGAEGYIPYGTLRITEADGTVNVVDAGNTSCGIVNCVAGRLCLSEDLCYPVYVEKID